MDTKHETKVIETMSDGTLRVTDTTKKDKGSQYGSYVKLAIDASEKDIKKAKKYLTNQMCAEIRKLAKRDDFFFIRECPEGGFLNSKPFISVGWRIICPTVKDDVNSLGFEG